MYWKTECGRTLVPLRDARSRQEITKLFEELKASGYKRVHFLLKCTPVSLMQELAAPTQFITTNSDYYIIHPNPDAPFLFETIFQSKFVRVTRSSMTVNGDDHCTSCFMEGKFCCCTSCAKHGEQIAKATIKFKGGVTIIDPEFMNDLKLYTWCYTRNTSILQCRGTVKQRNLQCIVL